MGYLIESTCDSQLGCKFTRHQNPNKFHLYTRLIQVMANEADQHGVQTKLSNEQIDHLGEVLILTIIDNLTIDTSHIREKLDMILQSYLIKHGLEVSRIWQWELNHESGFSNLGEI